MMTIDRSYNEYTLNELLDLIAGYKQILIRPDFSEVFDLVYELTYTGGKVSADEKGLLVTF